MAKIKISKNNYFHNLNSLTAVTTKEKLAVVLKDNAYGHGLLLMAELASEYGIQKAVVRTVQEAKIIENLFKMVLVLSDKSSEKLHHKIHITANSLEDLEIFPEGSRVHLKIDTGMHRNGIDSKDLQKALELCLKNNLEISGICSHSRSGDELSTECFWQIKNFTKLKDEVIGFCNEHKLKPPLFHLANSATLTRFKEEAVFDMVRAGIATYGYDENEKTLDTFDLKPVMSLWGDKISQRELLKGEKVGYGGGYELERDSSVGTYDIGYGDGFFRLNEKHEYFTPEGYRVLGKVSMDSLSLNCNHNQVKIFDNARNLAKIFDTITYDVLVKLKENIQREIEDDG